MGKVCLKKETQKDHVPSCAWKGIKDYACEELSSKARGECFFHELYHLYLGLAGEHPGVIVKKDLLGPKKH